jgi:prevent-host-death family protein
MVTTRTLMTMSRRWNIASAKAEFSHLVREACKSPQVIENRGRPVAVVVSADAYARMAETAKRTERWRAVQALSAQIRDEGGVTLAVPPRRPRPSPFARPRR